MSRILLIGTVTLDLVFELDHHPHADEEMRATALRTCRGGNAANSAVVLAQLGQQAEFLGTLADAPETAVIENDFLRYGVSFDHCPRLPGRPPTSSIYLSQGDRSIVHYRELPELSAQHVSAIPWIQFDWVHAEGRNVSVLQQVLDDVRQHAPHATVSIELEKHREGIAQLFGRANVLMCSRAFARHYGFDEPHAFLMWMASQAPGAVLMQAWGEGGAYGLDREGVIVHTPAMPPEQVEDTLGAGDTFNAAVIDATLRGLSMPDVLVEGCRVAGIKCGRQGFDFEW